MSYDFADRLIEMRRSRGLSQEELAKRLGLSRQAISKWERAESSPDVGNLIALAGIYEVTLDELVGTGNTQQHEEGACADKPAASEDAVFVAAPEIAAKPQQSSPTLPPPPHGVEPTIPATDPAFAQEAESTIPAADPVFVQGAAQEVFHDSAASVKPKHPLLTFPYPLLVALIYLVLGFCFHLWHPGWVIFFTIPFYYWIASVITHDPEYAARHGIQAD